MEKKNMVLLTVIAVATLLVAVVGATFAYFTASVTTTNDANKTTTITAKSLATASFDYGSNLTADAVFPGYKGVRKLSVKGAGDAGSQPIAAQLVIEASKPAGSGFASTVGYTVYKAAKTTDDIINCPAQGEPTSTVVDGVARYTAEVTCTGLDSTALTQVATGSVNFGGTITAIDPISITVLPSTNDVYYVVFDYAETGLSQNADMGQSFSFDLSFELV